MTDKACNCTALQPLCLSASDLAGLLRVSKRQIWALHQSGTIGPVPLKLSDRTTRWDADEVRCWWKACLAENRTIGRSEWTRRQQEVSP